MYLEQNIPNPFNHNSIFNFNLNNTSAIQVEITDMEGRLISKTDLGKLKPGKHSFEINSDGLKSGMYYYSLISEKERITKKMIIQ